MPPSGAGDWRPGLPSVLVLRGSSGRRERQSQVRGETTSAGSGDWLPCTRRACRCRAPRQGWGSARGTPREHLAQRTWSLGAVHSPP